MELFFWSTGEVIVVVIGCMKICGEIFNVTHFDSLILPDVERIGK